MTDGDATRWKRLKALFDEALDLDAAGRAVLLERARQQDAGLAQELAALLAAHERDDGLMAEATLGPEDWGAEPSSPPPAAIGRYRLLRLLGRGGMGEVWLAHDPQLDREVALKVLAPSLARHPRRRAQLVREARAAAALNHPNITTIHEIVEADGRVCIAFEHVQGRTLRDRLALGPLPLRELLDIALPLADALACAHERGLVHRDVKPANVMVTDRGLPKLLDFGIAVRGGEADEALAGTPAAMSPEQARGEAVDARSDVFAFGALLHEMASGRPAFEGSNLAATLDAVRSAEPPPLRTLRPEMPAALEALVAKALRKDPAQRHERMADLATELRQLAAAAARPAPRALTIAALSALAISVALLVRGWLASEAPAPHEVAAVMDFENAADPQDADGLAAMLGPLLAAQLSGLGDFSVIGDQRLDDIARELGDTDGRVDRAQASEVARRAGADTMALGRLSRAGGGLVATVDLMEVESGRTIAVLTARGAGAADVFSMAESLGRQARETLRRPTLTTAEQGALATRLTSSVDAFRSYVRGLDALRRHNMQEACAALEEATSIDPAFALAQMRLSMALIWIGRFDDSTRAHHRALAFRDKLPADLQRFADVMEIAGPNDDTRTALPMLLDILEQDPMHRDALYLVGETYTHSHARADARLAARTYERLLGIDPGLSLVYEHQLAAWLRLGRFDLAHAALERWAADPPSNLAALQGEVALWEGRFDDAARLQDSPLVADVLAGRHDAASVRAVLDADVPAIEASLKDAGGVYLVLELDLRANVLAAHGRLEEAAELYRRALAVPVSFLSRDGFFASVGGGVRSRLAAMLALCGDAAGARREVETALSLQPDSSRCLYQSALLALRDGDDATARERLATLAALVTPEWSPSAELYRDALAAELALAEGRATEARTGFTVLLDSGRLMEDWYCYEDSLGPFVRDGLARACVAAGDEAAASAALAGLIDAGFERLRQPLPWVQALLRRGELELRLGHEAEGRALIERFLAHWGSADHELDDVRRARELLAETR